MKVDSSSLISCFFLVPCDLHGLMGVSFQSAQYDSKINEDTG